MKKTELMLAKKSVIECMVGELVARPAIVGSRQMQMPAQQAQAGTEQHADMFKDMFAQWEALTSMKIEDGVAIIPVRGTVTPDDPFSAYFGETNLAMFNKNFDAALADPKVKAIVANIYSPGGYVYGVEAAANRVYQARGQKPLIAFTDSLAASAAYWLASAFDDIILGSETAEVGSIGVYLVHFDYSEMLTKEGIKVTEITSGEFKGIGSPYSAMTKEEEKVLQADSNYVYTRFVNTVARNRGMEVNKVLKSANGLTFYGSDAVSIGLADSIHTYQEVLAMATADNKGTTTQPTAEQQAAADKEAADKLKQKTDHDAVVAELASYKAKEAKDKADAAKAELNVAAKAAYGREATAAEIDFYTKLDDAGKKVYKDNLAETAANRDKVFQASGLTREQVVGDADTGDSNKSNGLLEAAAQRLHLAVATK